ncbi:MAG: dinitrogenase iron-molybdenum cofactor biosynthesis protein [Kosmotoga sp.]|nr:MAG: dinitrogenase iron-molybdenum cofactor biosynthesis protein [Kosmotoga sp.]
MIIAIPVSENKGENSIISEHFGRSPYYAFVETEKDEIKSISVEENPFSSHDPGDIPSYLESKGASVVITQGVGRRAKVYFDQLKLEVISGAYGTVRELVEAYINGSLRSVDYTPKEKFHEH